MVPPPIRLQPKALHHASDRIPTTSTSPKITAPISALYQGRASSRSTERDRDPSVPALARRSMDAAGAESASSSSPSSPSKLGHRLRTTVCGCFGGGSTGAAERVRWRRRGAAAGEFRYDALSYALNFDEGGDDDDACAADPFRYRNFNARLPPSPVAAKRPHQRATAIAVA